MLLKDVGLLDVKVPLDGVVIKNPNNYLILLLCTHFSTTNFYRLKSNLTKEKLWLKHDLASQAKVKTKVL